MTSNKQRKGQFIWNFLVDPNYRLELRDGIVSMRLWNISDSEFDAIMKAWSEQK